MNSLPPGLRGYALGQAQGQQRQAQELGMLAQLVQLQGQSEDRDLKRQLIPMQLQQQQAQLAELVRKTKHDEAKSAFFSPAGQAPFMEGGRPAVSLPEGMEGPVMPEQPGELNFPKMLKAAAGLNYVPAEAYATHRAQEEQRKLDAQQRGDLAREKMEQQLTLAREKAEDKTLSQAEQNRARMDMIRLAASLRQGPQPRAPIVQTDDAGNTKLYDHAGNLVKDLGAVGKPSATYAKAQASKKQLGIDLDRAITELEVATKDGGYIDQSTGSGAGALVDIGAGFFGKATPGSIAVGKMRPIYDLVLKMVPRFEGPQSDKDTKSYQEASGQLANPAVPNAQKKAAGKEVLRLMRSRQGQFVAKDIAGTESDTGYSGPDRRTAPSNVIDFNTLPPGR